MEDLIGVLVRISVAYLYVLAILKLSGKRSFGMLSTWDFMAAITLGDVFDDIMWGEIAVSQWVVGVSTLITLHLLLSYLSYRSRTIDRIVGLTPVTVVRAGNVDQNGMAHERLRHDVLLSHLRLKGIDGVAEVREAIREPGGRTSVFKMEEARPVQKRDLPGLREAA